MAKAIDLSTAGIHVGYGIEANAGTKPSAFIDILNDTEWKRYIEGLKDVGGALAITFGMSQVFLDMWEDICDKYETAIASDKRMWLVFYHPRLNKSFFFTCEPTRMGWAAADVDSAWDTSVSVTPTGEIGWAEAIEPKAATESA